MVTQLSGTYASRICLSPPDAGRDGLDFGADDRFVSIETEIDIDGDAPAGNNAPPPAIEVTTEDDPPPDLPQQPAPTVSSPPAAGEDGIEVNVDGGQGQQDQRQTQPPPAEDPRQRDPNVTPNVQKRIDRLTFERHQAQRERDELARQLAEREAQLRNLSQGYTATADAAATNYEAVLANRERELAAQYREAYENGDPQVMFKVQQDLYRHTQEVERLAQWKREREQQTRQPEPAAQPQQAAPAAQQQPQASPRAIKWMKSHEAWWQKNRAMTAAAFAIDAELKNEGYDPESEDYYEALDARLRSEFPHRFQNASAAAPPPANAQSGAITPPVAAPTRTAGPSNGSAAGSRKVTLTKSELQMAENLGITPQQYAVEKLRMQSGTATY